MFMCLTLVYINMEHGNSRKQQAAYFLFNVILPKWGSQFIIYSLFKLSAMSWDANTEISY